MRTFKPKAAEKVALDFTGLPTDKPIAVYYRQSTQVQVGNVATDMQRVDLAEDLKRLGYSEDKIILVDTDEGVSGTLPIDEREGMTTIYDLVYEQKIGAVACFDEDRLFRDATGIEYNKFIENCRKNRVVVWTPDTTYMFHHPTMGKTWIKIFRQKCDMAAEALDLIKKRLGGAKQRLAREGKHEGRPLPYGYMADVRDKFSPTFRQIVPFPEYAVLAQRIFEVFVACDGNPRETYRRLLAEGFRIPSLSECLPPTGYRTNYRDASISGVPTVKTIRAIVTNPFYIGHYMKTEKNENGEAAVAFVRWNNHEAIIPEELFFRAFNYISKFDLQGNPNPHYCGVGRTHIVKAMPPRTAERPLCEGKAYVYLEEKWQKVGVWYQGDSDRFNYGWGGKKLRPGAPAWERAANWLDEAVIYHLRERLLSTLDLSEIKKTVENKEAALDAERRHIENQIKDTEQQLKLREQKIARLTNLTLLENLEREYTAMQVDHARLLAKRDQLSEQPSSNLEDILKHLQGFNKPETMPRAELRRFVVALIDRVAIVSEGQHQGDNISIEWVDGKTTDFYLQHRANDKGWSYAEIEALKRGIAEGWTQLELVAACPNHTWHEIKVRICRYFGTGINIPKVRDFAHIQLIGLERGDITEAELRKYSNEEQKELRRLRSQLRVRHWETYADYCHRVLGFVPGTDNRNYVIAAESERENISSAKILITEDGVAITEAGAKNLNVSNSPVSEPSSSAPRSPCRG